MYVFFTEYLTLSLANTALYHFNYGKETVVSGTSCRLCRLSRARDTADPEFYRSL